MRDKLQTCQKPGPENIKSTNVITIKMDGDRKKRVKEIKPTSLGMYLNELVNADSKFEAKIAIGDSRPLYR